MPWAWDFGGLWQSPEEQPWAEHCSKAGSACGSYRQKMTINCRAPQAVYMCSSDELSVLSRKVSKLWFLLHVCVMEFLMVFFNHLPLMMNCLCKCLVTYPFTVKNVKSWRYLTWRRRQKCQSFVPKLSVMAPSKTLVIQRASAPAPAQSSRQQEEAALAELTARCCTSHPQPELLHGSPFPGGFGTTFLCLPSKAAMSKGAPGSIFPFLFFHFHTWWAGGLPSWKGYSCNFRSVFLLSLWDLTILYLLIIFCYFCLYTFTYW